LRPRLDVLTARYERLITSGTQKRSLTSGIVSRHIEHYLDLLPDSLATYLEWRRLIVAHTISGVAVHDARIVASMKVYNVHQLVTFNVDDFRRYRGLSVLTPQALSSLAP